MKDIPNGIIVLITFNTIPFFLLNNVNVIIANEINKKAKKAFAQVSDEFYQLANLPIPDKKYSAQFSQIEDGVGTTRLVLDDETCTFKEKHTLSSLYLLLGYSLFSILTVIQYVYFFINP